MTKLFFFNHSPKFYYNTNCKEQAKNPVFKTGHLLALKIHFYRINQL